MGETYRVAVATQTGDSVDVHYGRASRFQIYEIEELESIDLIEVRELIPVCADGEHDPVRLEENAKKLNDCRCVIASRIGPGALNSLAAEGIEGYELPGDIEEAIDRMVRYRQVQRLFK